MTALLPRFLDSSVLSLAELCAARLDGELFSVGDAFVLLDTPDTAELRAGAFHRSAPRGVVADRLTASWIHGVRATPPAPWQVCGDSARRISATAAQGIDLRQCVLGRGDVEVLGDARVTTPLRTAVDLLRIVPRFTRQWATEILALLELDDTGFDACRRSLRRHPHSPGNRRALERLGALE
ncbi:hypothetical protein ACFVWR_05470 [Leifsonia sp. NPDC058292]|uniref:hypothetical protein n=1 Tax=Leifsonia sp. NPDC058292 TaxID=3346428 RepID=UPI0036DAEA7E